MAFSSFYQQTDKPLSECSVCFSKHYRSVKEFMDAVANDKTTQNHKNATWVLQNGTGDWASHDSWWGVSSGGVGRLLEWSKNGWKDGVKQIRDALKVVTFQGVTSTRRRKVRKDFGDYVDMQSVYSGNLERAWGTTERVAQKGLGRNVATLMVNISAGAFVSQAQAFWRGALLVTLADALQASGRSVRIIGFDVERGAFEEKPGELSWRSFVIKEADSPLMLERLAFVTACVGFLRYFGFKAQGAGHDFTLTRGMGGAVNIAPGTVTAKNLPKGLEKQMGDAGTWVIDGVWNKWQAEKFLDGVSLELGNVGAVSK